MENCGRARQATGDNIKWHMHFACWMSKATNTNSECEILPAYPLQQWLHEYTLLLRLYVRCLSC
jgi:hypothetical protein